MPTNAVVPAPPPHPGPRRRAGRTLAQKLWDSHIVKSTPAEPDLLYVDLHLVHEVTSPQAFEGLRLAGRRVRRPDLTVATTMGPQVVPTKGGVRAARRAVAQADGGTGGELPARGHPASPDRQPTPGHRARDRPGASGLTQPGMPGDRVRRLPHVDPRGFRGAWPSASAHPRWEMVPATQCLPQNRLRDLAVNVEGELPLGVTAKDVVLGLIGRTGISEGQGHLVEYRGSTINSMSMEGRMTICNMSIEWGAKAGMIAPDDTTFRYAGSCRPHRAEGCRMGYRPRLLAVGCRRMMTAWLSTKRSLSMPATSNRTSPGARIPARWHR